VFITSGTAPFPRDPGEMQDFYNQRNYLEALQKSHRGWVFLPHLTLECRKREMKIPDINGAVYTFRDGKLIQTPGLSNASGDTPSGKFDPRNIKITENQGSISVILPNGTTRTYNPHRGCFFNLVKEVLPNGKVVKYDYSENLITIKSFAPLEKHHYASLTIHTNTYENKLCINDHKKRGSCGNYKNTIDETIKYSVVGVPYLAVDTAITNTGLIATYDYESTDRSSDLDKKCGHFRYQFFFIPNLKTASSPFFRKEKIEYENYLPKFYSGRSRCLKANYKGSPFRIESLELPNGENDIYIPIHTLDIEERTTSVTQRDGCKTIYTFSPQKLPLLIEFLAPNGKLVKVKAYTWDVQNRLSSIEWRDGDSTTFWKKSFEEYDAYNNPQKEIFSGDLTGSGKVDSYTTSRSFSKDGRNLLLQETTEDQLTTTFEYLPNTNLLKSRTIKGQDVQILETFEYENNNLSKKTISDENELRITSYKLRQEQPFLHMPEWIEESSEKLLKKTKLSYDAHGNIAQEDMYGSDDTVCYSIKRTFDEQGNLLTETNPLGHTATTTYTSEGYLENSEGFSKRLKTKREYNTAGRLKKITETGEGIVHTTRYGYDSMGRLEQETDPFENVTQHTEYDCVANLPTKTESAQIDINMPVVKKALYDGLGRILEKRDANNNTTKYKYNAYGSLTEITYPNGSQEKFLYFKNGHLQSHTNQENLVTEYSYDVLGRVTEKRYTPIVIQESAFGQLSIPPKSRFLNHDRYTHNERLIAKETYTYSSLRLQTHTDKEGYITTYSYDKAGRKIEENRAGRVIEFGYDILGRPCKKIYKNTVTFVSNLDPLGRLLEEGRTDQTGAIFNKISYTYDPDGNRSTITHYPNNFPAKITYFYDPFARLVKILDPLGFETTTHYDESKLSPLNQKVLTKTITNPNQIRTMITYDPYGREAARKISNLREEERRYDPAGNLLQIKEGTRIIRYTYNALNDVETLTQGYGTPEARETIYHYTPSGLLKTKIQPSGIVLNYTYDPFGHVKTLVSSDGSLSHKFTYNLNGNLIHASDHIHAIDLTLDPFGNTLTETIDGKYTLTKTYDNLDRPLTHTLSDQSSIRYVYNPVYLKTVERRSPTNEVLYTHTFDSYDLSGGPLTKTLPFNLGKETRSYTPNQEISTLETPYLSQRLIYDPAGRIISVSSEGTFTYDDLDQLETEPSHTYAYDSSYNRTRKDAVILTYNDLDQLVGANYDLNENLIEKDGLTLSYDSLNRLIKAESGVKSFNYTYDPLGRRFTKTSDEKEFYLYDGVNEIASLDTNGKLKHLRVPGLSQTPVALELEGQVFIPILDYRGSIRKLIDPQAQVAQSFDYTAFGEETTSILKPYNPWRYATKRFDIELGLSYFGSRYYDANLGRWITTDPAGYIDGINLYAYLHNDPLNYYDPNGEFALALLGFSWGASGCAATAILSNPIGWAVGGALVATAGIYWATDRLSNSGQISHSTVRTINTVVGGFAGSMINSMNNISSTGYSELPNLKKKGGERRSSDEPCGPPYRGDLLGNDGSKNPDAGFEWKGRGPPGSAQGKWVRGPKDTQESLHPDLHHPEPIGPHWDYQGPGFPKGARIYPDGTWSPK
jgi:RHS repeat-associated protein